MLCGRWRLGETSGRKKSRNPCGMRGIVLVGCQDLPENWHSVHYIVAPDCQYHPEQNIISL